MAIQVLAARVLHDRRWPSPPVLEGGRLECRRPPLPTALRSISKLQPFSKIYKSTIYLHSRCVLLIQPFGEDESPSELLANDTIVNEARDVEFGEDVAVSDNAKVF